MPPREVDRYICDVNSPGTFGTGLALPQRYLRSLVWILVGVICLGGPKLHASDTIDPTNDGSQHAWGENIGWIHLQAGIDLSIERYSSTYGQLQWFGVDGYTYAFYTSPDMANWTFGTTALGHDATIYWLVPYSTHQTNFYKVEQLSPAGYGVKTSW